MSFVFFNINQPQKIYSVTTDGSTGEEVVVLKKRDKTNSSNRKAKRLREIQRDGLAHCLKPIQMRNNK
jgi:hypothetical protein